MTDRDAVIRRQEDFVESFATGDVEAMAEYLTEDHVGMPPNRPRVEGREGAKEFWREGFSLAESRFSTRSQDVALAGDLAIDRFHWDMTVTPRDGSPAVEDTGKCVWIWRREAGAPWRLAVAIWNSDLESSALWSGG